MLKQERIIEKRIKTPECLAKRKASFKKWVKNNPEKYKAWQEKLISSRTSQKANEKRKASLKEWYENKSTKSESICTKKS